MIMIVVVLNDDSVNSGNLARAVLGAFLDTLPPLLGPRHVVAHLVVPVAAVQEHRPALPGLGEHWR